MAESRYVYDQAWGEERARLAGIEALWDDGTRQVLLSSGVAPGAAVLEVGAGGGSITAWLAEQVGPIGRVLATDIDTRFVDPLASDAVEVLRADIVADALPQAEFDVVHVRLVLEHLTEREAALDNLVRALRPGGRLVVEDYDWTAFGFDPGAEIERRATDAVLGFMAQAGFEATYGRRVVSSLAARGLVDVRGVGRSQVIDADHPGYAFFQLSFEQLAPAIVQAGLLSEREAGEVGERMASGAYRVITPTLVAAVGRRI
jgi:ubiquinone/menaquinone biosynthesis C-methylase UbiE